MRRILIAACALLLLVVLPGVVIKRGPHSSSGQTGDGSTPLSNLFYMGPNADELCIDPDTDEDATVPDACDIAITPTGIDVAAGATGQCWTLKEGSAGGAITHQWCVPNSIDNGAITGQFDDDTTPFDSGVLKCKDWTYINPAVPVDHMLWKNTSGAVVTIQSVDCIAQPDGAGDSVVITINECDATGDNCAGIDGATTITCSNTGAADDGTLSNPTIDDNDWVGITYGTVTSDPTSLTYQVCYKQTAID